MPRIGKFIETQTRLMFSVADGKDNVENGW
jgi:hypothetical protein